MEVHQFKFRDRVLDIQFEDLGEGRYRIDLDGQPAELEVRAVDANTYSILMGERHHLVYIARSPEAIYLHIDGQAFRLEPVRESREARSSSEQPAGQAERNITAPMPGKILKLMVREGQQVSAGEGLFILEAMKMENEVRAPQQAVVEKIHVQEGELVSVGEVVLELHYPENDQSGN